MYDSKEIKDDSKVSYTAIFRDLVSVKRNVVSMPKDKGSDELVEFNVTKEMINAQGAYDHMYDSGPPQYPHVFEVKLVDRLFTLYSNDMAQTD